MYSYHGLVCCYGDIVHFVDVVVQVLLGVGQYKLAQVLPGLFGWEGRRRSFDTFRRPNKFRENKYKFIYACISLRRVSKHLFSICTYILWWNIPLIKGFQYHHFCPTHEWRFVKSFSTIQLNIYFFSWTEHIIQWQSSEPLNYSTHCFSFHTWAHTSNEHHTMGIWGIRVCASQCVRFFFLVMFSPQQPWLVKIFIRNIDLYKLNQSINCKCVQHSATNIFQIVSHKVRRIY